MADKSALKALAFEFIKHNRDAAFSTSSTGNVPHVAVVYCKVTKDLTLYFSTRTEARKFQNITANNTVAMAFWDPDRMATIQLTGMATRVTDLQAEQKILYELLTLRSNKRNWQSPPIQLYQGGATNELAIIKVVPTEMTYADFQPRPDGRYKSFFQKII